MPPETRPRRALAGSFQCRAACRSSRRSATNSPSSCGCGRSRRPPPALPASALDSTSAASKSITEDQATAAAVPGLVACRSRSSAATATSSATTVALSQVAGRITGNGSSSATAHHSTSSSSYVAVATVYMAIIVNIIVFAGRAAAHRITTATCATTRGCATDGVAHAGHREQSVVVISETRDACWVRRGDCPALPTAAAAYDALAIDSNRGRPARPAYDYPQTMRDARSRALSECGARLHGRCHSFYQWTCRLLSGPAAGKHCLWLDHQRLLARRRTGRRPGRMSGARRAPVPGQGLGLRVSRCGLRA